MMNLPGLPALLVHADEQDGYCKVNNGESVDLPPIHTAMDSMAMVGNTFEKTVLDMNRTSGKAREKPSQKAKIQEEKDKHAHSAPLLGLDTELLSAGSLSSSDDEDSHGGDSLTVASKSTAPVMPPRFTHKGFALPEDERRKARWFRILSPREQRGVDGPYSEDELKNMYKQGELPDSTMMWAEGQKDWEQLLFMKELRPRLIPKPMLPPKMGKQVDAVVYNPITDMPDKLDAMNAEAFESMPLNLYCSRCGSVAAGHMKGKGENSVDLIQLRKSVPWNVANSASEVLPGLIWVGNGAAAKLNPLLDMSITLVINCTNNMGNPAEKLPYFRCRTVPLKDKPKGNPDAKQIAAIMDLLEKTYDWMELERTNPEKALLSDPIALPPKLTDKTDKFGRPIKTVEEIAVRLRIGKEKRTPRILLWSRRGLDRPCFIAAAYMIRQYGMSFDKVMAMLDIARPGMIICRFYKICLEAWSNKYTKGEMLCIDCLNVAKHNHSHTTHNEKLLDNAELFREDGTVIDKDNAQAMKTLGSYLDMQLTEGEASKMQKTIGEVDVYLKKIYFGHSLQSGWTGLMDMDLFGHPLGDDLIFDLFSALASTGVSKQLRSIGMGSTKCGCRGMLAIKNALCLNEPTQIGAGPQTVPGSPVAGGVGNSFAIDEEGSVEHKSSGTSLPMASTHGGIETLVEQSLSNIISMNCNASEELIDLDVSNNKIEQDGCGYISEILRQVTSLTNLNVSYNPLTDAGCRIILEAVSPPFDEFGGDTAAPGAPIQVNASKSQESSDGVKQASVIADLAVSDQRYSSSLTSINVSCCCMGHAVAEKLLNTFRENTTLTRFIMDFNTDLTPKEFKHILNTIRSYNQSIQHLSVADMPMSLKSFGYLTRLLETGTVPLMVLDISKCELRLPHIRTLCQHIIRSRQLTRLIIGSNEVGDEAACELAYAIKVLTEEEKQDKLQRIRADKLEDGFTEKEIERQQHEQESLERAGMISTQGAPLTQVDFSHMGLSPIGTQALLKAVCTRTTITYVNLSGNSLGTDIEPLRPWLKDAYFRDLHINYCKLGSVGGSTMLNICSDTTCILATKLRALDISSNNISDLIAPEIVNLLNNNMSIEVLDLGFNVITDAARSTILPAYSVHSDSRIEKKVFGLHINVVGNLCDPYMLGEPGMGRSKQNFRFGTGPSQTDNLNDGYSHISQISRKHHFERKAAVESKVFDNFDLQYPITHMN